MTDRYLEFSHTHFGASLARLLGLPRPPRLKRAAEPWAQHPLQGRPALAGATVSAGLAEPLVHALHGMGATIRVQTDSPGLAVLKRAAAARQAPLANNPPPSEGEASYALIFDASGLTAPDLLRELYDFYQPQIGRLPPNGRVLVLTRSADAVENAAEAALAAALRGFVKSLGKEIGKRGATANLIEVARGGEKWIEGALRFLLTEHAAFVDGQSLRLSAGAGDPPTGWVGMLSGKQALVTGAARGIGAAIARTLAREGAQVIGLDRPQEEGALAEAMGGIRGYGLAVDITAPDAPERIVEALASRGIALDVVIHNAGITRDKLLRNMPPHYWDQVIAVNLGAILRINEKLLQQGLNDGARMVCISSIGGIAGNAGQTNYGATKAAIIGYCRALAPEMAKRGGAINAVAPGFIETQMTAAMPLIPREVGRRLNSLSQGGLPEDIAEAVTFLAGPAAGGVNGACLRVCGQSWFGA